MHLTQRRTQFRRSSLRVPTCRTLLTIGLLLCTGSGCGCASSSGTGSSLPTEDRSRVTLELPTDGGDLVSIGARQGPPRLLEFWSPSCVPCRQAVPALLSRREEIESRGAVIHLVAVLADGETTELARETLRSWGVQEPFLVARDNIAAQAAGVMDLPTTLIVDSDGTVVWRSNVGDSVDQAIRALP